MEKSCSECIRDEVHARGDATLAAHHCRYFQAFPGGYAENDRFIGVKVPVLRKIAATHRRRAGLRDIDELLDSPWHELRFVGLVLLTRLAEQGAKRTPDRLRIRHWRSAWEQGRDSPLLRMFSEHADPVGYADCVFLYLARIAAVNHWDLVDISAPAVLGPAVFAGGHAMLAALARSRRLREERIAVLSTLYTIRRGEFGYILEWAEYFLDHPHDLIHKVVGWMLREMGKQNPKVLRGFLDTHDPAMPRTMLRYSIERLPEAERTGYLRRM